MFRTNNKSAPLADRVATLERELKKTREQVQEDMKRLIEMVAEAQRK